MIFTQEHVGRKWTLVGVQDYYWLLTYCDPESIRLTTREGQIQHYTNGDRAWSAFIPLPHMPDFIGPRLLKPVKGKAKQVACIPF